MYDPARLRLFLRPCTGFAQFSGLLAMSSTTDTGSRSFGGRFRSKWKKFAVTPPGDTFAAFLTIAVMFGAMFGCAFIIVLGIDGLQLILRPH
jgi:hypothetical protein